MKKYIVNGSIANGKLTINQTTVSENGKGMDLTLSLTQDYADKLLSVICLFPNNSVWKSFPTAVSNNAAHVFFDAGNSDDFNATGKVYVSADVLNRNGILSATVGGDNGSAFQITEEKQNLTLSDRNAIITDVQMELGATNEKEELLELIAQVRHDLEIGAYKGDKGEFGAKGQRGDPEVVVWGVGAGEPPISTVFWDEAL